MAFSTVLSEKHSIAKKERSARLDCLTFKSHLYKKALNHYD